MLPLRREYLTPPSDSTEHHRFIYSEYVRKVGEQLLKEMTNDTYELLHLATLYNDTKYLWDFCVQIAEVRGAG